MLKFFSKKNVLRLTILLILALITIIFLWQYLNSYLKRSKAEGTSITLSLIPATLSFDNQDFKEIQLIAQFQNGSASEKIDYFKAKIKFPKDNLELVDLPTIDPSSLDLSSVRTIQVDGPVTANASGEVIIELGAASKNSGPATNSPPIVAKIKFKGKLPITNGTITIDNVEIVNNVSAPITQITKNNITFVVFTEAVSPTITPLSCNQLCNIYDSPRECEEGLVCQGIEESNENPGQGTAMQVRCRNPQCPDKTNCVCEVPGCLCAADGTCTTSCTFDTISDIIYILPIKCSFSESLSSSLFATTPSADNKTSWCQATKRTKGDADGNGVVDDNDYYLYVGAANGGQIPSTTNPDFNGDGEVGASDRVIIMKTLKP